MSDRSITLGSALLALVVAFALPSAADPIQDPTRPPAFGTSVESSESGEAEALSLQAVFQADSRRIAIVNDQRVGVGDVVLSARVVSIEGDRVTLRRQGRTIELELIPVEIKRRTQRGAAGRDDAPLVAAPDRGNAETVETPPARREGFES